MSLFMSSGVKLVLYLVQPFEDIVKGFLRI